MISIIIKNEQININIECDENVELISYENALNQVILNLFSNSKDAFVSNSVKNRKIDITILKTKLKNCIIFKDNGGGIDKSIIGRIFEPYFTTKHNKAAQGTGIGLYMSKQIIENQLGGKIEVKNSYFDKKKSERGCEFIISFERSDSGFE